MIRLLSSIRLFLAFAALALGGALAAPSAWAARAVPAKLTEADQRELARVEAYLNTIRTLRSDFLQVAENGATAQGEVTIQRPGRMRIEYAPPTPHLIVATGRFLIYHEKHLKQTSYLPLDSSLAGFLVRDTIRLSGDVTVIGFEKQRGAIRVTLAKTDEREAGTLTLVFSDQPLELRQWTVTDGQGQTTRISLMEPEFGVPVDAKKFVFQAPERPYDPLE